MTFDISHSFDSVMSGIRRKRALCRLNKGLALTTDEEMSGLLTEAGIERKDLFTSFDGNAPHRRRMGRMLMYFGIDRIRASGDHWDDLVQAETRCARCRCVGRCQRWLDADYTNLAPKTFCPNAGLFEFIRSAQARLAAAKARVYPFITGSSDSIAARVEGAWNGMRGHEEKPFWRR